MLKLIIADDERVTRETIAGLIDWEELGVSLIGSCRNGMEAYNMILDETPDIVMTDIRMPGLSGLELVKDISQTDLQTQFIILSGYEEFDYARKAMKYGIRHYLVKPCNAKQIAESILEVAKDCQIARSKQEAENQQNVLLRTLRQDAVHHLITDGLAIETDNLSERKEQIQACIELYDQYIDFTHSTYQLYYAYYLEQERLESMIEYLCKAGQEKKLSANLYGVYVKNTLLLFSQEVSWGEEIRRICAEHFLQVQLEEVIYSDLTELMEIVLSKIKRYDKILSLHDFKLRPILNNHHMIQQLKQIYQSFKHAEKTEITKLCNNMIRLLDGMDEPEFLQFAAGNISMYFASIDAYSSAETAEFMMKMNQLQEADLIRESTKKLILKIQEELYKTKQGYGSITDQVMTYVEQHITDQGLTLKKIAEQILYLNVDHVSRQFQKATGQKFSQYLTNQRVKRAKELLMTEATSKIQYVTEQVGYGDNTQYFSQVFKKQTGMTPSKWAQQMK